MKISILIPTRQRREYLAICLRSCLAQKFPPLEILIGDDSENDDTQRFVSDLATQNSLIPLRYFRHQRPLGQDGNVHFLMQAAAGSHLLLIHDDDWLLPNATADLAAAFSHPHIVISFGRQLLAMDNGTIQEPSRSAALNHAFRRSSEYSGLQPNLRETALCGQFPNNGWLVEREAALRVDYRDPEKAFGTGSDYRFSALFAEVNPLGKAFLVDREISVYRHSKDSIARSGRSTAAMHCFAYALRQPAELRTNESVAHWLKGLAPSAVAQATTHGEVDTALRWYWSSWHRPHLLTAGGIKRGFRLLAAVLVRTTAKAIPESREK